MDKTSVFGAHGGSKAQRFGFISKIPNESLRFCVFVRGIFKKKLCKVLCIGLTLVLLLTTVFFCRKPVIMVTDAPFNELYGEKRIKSKQFALSLSLFRPIKTVSIADGAGPDLAAQGAAGLSRRPFAVFFPYRYREGARRYLKNRPGFPVVILGGRSQGEPPAAVNEGPEEPLWLFTDTETDLYRAGTFAGIIAQEGPDLYIKGIALYGDGLGRAEKTAFQKGLEEQQWFGSPLFPSNSAEHDLACAVVLKKLEFNEEEKARAIILFSWMDPALASRRTLAVFDDSPWAQIGPALDILKKGMQMNVIPSQIIILRGDKALKKVYNRISEQKTLKYTVETADN